MAVNIVLDAAPTDIDRLRAFAQAVMAEAGQGCDMDGGEATDLAAKFGLIALAEIAEPCGENCVCAEVCDFPTTCYRATAVLTGEKP